MTFPLESEIDKITFVGRPLDPNKGFTSLLDALELLLDLPEIPHFQLWVIGGEINEMNKISQLLKTRPKLNQLMSQGWINIWGRVKRESLPEFYKRSSLVVMPSHREPFGLVAIESMLCGCPVIGTKQGGLSDTIIHGITGIQADLDSPRAIANSILLYLRNPLIRKTRGGFARKWAKFAFTKSNVYDQVRQLYHDRTVPVLKKSEWELSKIYSESSIKEVLYRVEQLLGVGVDEYHIVTSRYHVVAKIKTRLVVSHHENIEC
ncbi:glycosyltransferase family 4 protein [Oceanospirillum beijerinckii]|uniref:glycosyltransferase family 4 protein n=1 Tax=Oceanospirillum beijerinckii TaxID=64976 RepID=UPI00041233A8|nr:glycosyltransferase family 4 protein [Oceanospirillum beijerinckii]